MANLFTQEFEDKYNGAVSDKENSPFKDKIIQSLNDIVIHDEWAALKKVKSEIKDAQSYAKYIEDLKQFFNNICEKITAPGVDAFIDWMNQFGKINTSNCTDLRTYLINKYQYSDYADKIETILANKGSIEYNANNPKLFDILLKVIHKSIKSSIDALLLKPELFDTSVVPFLDEQSKHLESLAKIKELAFSSIDELYSDLQKADNISFYQDIIEDAVKYLNDVKPAKYFEQEEKGAEGIINKINDLKKFIKTLDCFGIASETNPVLKIIFEKTKTLIIGKQGILEQQWNEYETKTWNNLETAHDIIAKFFLDKNDVNIESLVKGKTKWQLPEIQTELYFLVAKYDEVCQGNPLEGIDKIAPKDLVETLSKKKSSIDELIAYAVNFKSKLLTILNSKVSDFETNKIPIVESISKSTPSIKKQLDEITDKISALKLVNTQDYKSKEFFYFLSNDFDNFYEIYETLDSSYTVILSNAGLKENIEWLNEKLQASDELELAESDLKNVDKLIPLMTVNLIKIKLSKNVS